MLALIALKIIIEGVDEIARPAVALDDFADVAARFCRKDDAALFFITTHDFGEGFVALLLCRVSLCSSGFAGGGLSEHAVEKRLEGYVAAVDVVGDEMFLHEIGRGGFCINVACGNAPFLSEQINDLTELFKAQLKGCHVGQKPFWHGHGAA